MKRKHWRKTAVLLTIILMLAIFSGGCRQAGGSNINTYKTVSEQFFLPAGDSTYIFAEAVYPANFPKGSDMPLVAMGHGYSGTLNSGGAKELAHKLASLGIAAIRLDFNPRTAAYEDAEKTNTYNLKTMEAAMVSGIDYMTAAFQIDEDRIALYARSMGGRVAMTMANENAGAYDYKALALVAPAGNENAMIDYMGGPGRWDEMKLEAAAGGFVVHKGLKLEPVWFELFEDYNPCEHGSGFGEKPVLVICNTLDNVVTADTSRECAAAYKNSRVIEVTTDNYHGYEMGYKESELKDYLMEEICNFFYGSLCAD